jgi:Lrp/AsnC family transcriptional regulator, leucine-responsive regulatory protein
LQTLETPLTGVNGRSRRSRAIIPHIDAIDRKILSLLQQDGRRTYDDIARRVSLSAPSVKRRIDRLLESGALEGFTALVDHGALGWNTEALVELFYEPGTTLDEVARILGEHPEVVEAWSVTGEADAIARVRTSDNADLERLIIDLQRNGLVVRTRSQVVLSRLVSRGT